MLLFQEAGILHWCRCCGLTQQAAKHCSPAPSGTGERIGRKKKKAHGLKLIRFNRIEKEEK